MRLLINITGLVLILAGLVGTGRYIQENSLLLAQSPIDEARSLANQERWSEAALWLNWIIDSRPDLDDPDTARIMLEGIEQQARNTRLSRFGKGMVTGEVDDVASLAGSSLLDLIVLGDIRDLVVQGYRQIYTDDGDMIILALSGVGLATTVVPHIDWVPSMLKGFKRSGSYTSGFTKSLTDASRAAFKTGNFNEIGKVVKDSGTVITTIGPSGFRASLKSVESAGQLHRLARAVKVSPSDTYIVASRFGQKGMQKVTAAGDNIVEVAGKIKVISRGGKVIKKSVPLLPLRIWLVLMATGCLLLFRRRILAMLFLLTRSLARHMRIN